MVDHPPAELLGFAAWPLDLVFDRDSCVGFVMQSAIGRKEAHRLYSPKDRKAEFDCVDWRFLVRATSNIAKAFAAVHEAGAVIGDVNHSSVMIAPDATAMLIDCDSFQVEIEGRIYPCAVGEPLHTAPELYGQELSTTARTSSHDSFGLAVLIFELLFMGKHPFAGSYSGREPLSLEDKIRRFMFAYGSEAGTQGVGPPAMSLSLDDLPESVAAKFELAFQANGIHARPSAIDWARELDQLHEQLRTCEIDASHIYYEGIAKCPWCRIEKATGAQLFNVGLAYRSGPAGGFNLPEAWKAIESVAPPESLSGPELQISEIVAPQAVRLQARRQRISVYGAILAILTTGGLGASLSPQSPIAPAATVVALLVAVWVSFRMRTKAIEPVQRRVNEAEIEMQLLLHSWETNGSEMFGRLYKELVMARAEYEALERRKLQELDDLMSTAAQRYRQRHLESHLIAQHPIEGLSLARCVDLAQKGVETAADVTPGNLSAAGVKTSPLRSTLLEWRREIERSFHYDPATGLDPLERKSVEQRYANRRIALEADLTRGAQVLMTAAEEIEQSRLQLTERARAAEMDRLTAIAERRLLSRI
jgi:DNA-binding helix-hairpin-helix protein with protein kinase domain